MAKITRDSIEDIWGDRTPYENAEWPVRADERTLETPDEWVQSACGVCSNGCGLDIGVKDGRIVGVRGRQDDHCNRGRLGPKGLHAWEANNSPDRLTQPLIRRNGQLEPASWDEAMGLVVAQAQTLRERYTASTIGFYTSGQIFLEAYYTLAVIGKAGLGTPHMDGSTRLCTATAGAALKETFGSDGQPASYFDIDSTDTIFMIGHNMATTDTVLWSRILDRRRAANPPTLIVVDPRNTATAAEADIHLAPKVGTNVSLLNGLLHLLIENGRIDRDFIDTHTIGFDNLQETVSVYTPERVAKDTELTADELRSAADAIGKAERLVSTVLQGVYQSNQATAAAVQVNNINLIRGMIGRPGCGIFQMNGQPTAQNNRETGADGDLPGFRNWNNLAHIEELAELWNVDAATIPHWAPPTHALNIFHQANAGSIRMLWISATNPAVSLPDLGKCRKTLAKEGLFVVVQDAFLNETTDYADVVLPAALWGEKTGCFTNVDRTVHLSRKAIEPPGEARSDFDIFVDFARRMDFRDKDNQPLISWNTPEEAFEAWKKCSRGRPCDYSGMSYKKLAATSGIQWPCNDEYPDGRTRIYTDLKFPSDSDYCERFGHDLETGGMITEEEHRAMNLSGRAFLKAAEQQPHVETPDDDYPMWLTTGRRVHQWHTRTKTGRSEALQKAQPEPYVQINPEDAEAQGIADGDLIRVNSKRGHAVAPARVRNIRRGHVFLPFHYGYWHYNLGDQRESQVPTAANELTIYVWDPVSKQPSYKYAAVRLEKVEADEVQEHAARKPATNEKPGPVKKAMDSVACAVKPGAEGAKEKPQYPAHVAEYISLLITSEKRMKRGFGDVRKAHMNVPDIDPEMSMFSKWSDHAVELLEPFAAKYGEKDMDEVKRLDQALDLGRAGGSFALVRDLHDLWLMVNESMMSLIVLDQAAEGLKDKALMQTLRKVSDNNGRQKRWLLTRIRQAAPQALVVPS